MEKKAMSTTLFVVSWIRSTMYHEYGVLCIMNTEHNVSWIQSMMIWRRKYIFESLHSSRITDTAKSCSRISSWQLPSDNTNTEKNKIHFNVLETHIFFTWRLQAMTGNRRQGLETIKKLLYFSIFWFWNFSVKRIDGNLH